MKLLDINICIKIDNSQEIADFIKEVDADIVAIQEMVRHLEDSVLKQFRSKEDIEKELGGLYPHKFFGPLWVAKDIKEKGKIIYDFGGHIEVGNEVLSKFPIVEATSDFYYQNYSYVLDCTNWKQEDHGRALQVVELEKDRKKFQVLNLHGIWTEDRKGDKRTINQCQYVVNAAKRKNLPTIIAGDFNLLPSTRSIKIIEKEFRNLVDEYQIKATRLDFENDFDEGRNVVDYVFVSSDIKVKGFKVIDTNISDHLPLVLEFEI